MNKIKKDNIIFNYQPFIDRMEAKYVDHKQVDTVLTFAQKSGIDLFPMQRFILKIIYDLELDTNLPEPIILTDEFDNILFETKSEIKLKKWLTKNGYLHANIDRNKLYEIVFVMGRRATKSTIVLLCNVYDLHVLLKQHYDPSTAGIHNYLRILPQTPIEVQVLSNKKTNAATLHQYLKNMVYGSGMFSKWLVSTEDNADIELRTSRLPNVGNLSISVQVANNSTRGGTVVRSILDEVAHYLDSSAKKSDKTLDYITYDAISPSIVSLVGEQNRPLGKIFLLSSPNGKKGLLYSKFQRSKESEAILAIKLPSWWVNPQISKVIIEEAYKTDREVAEREYGAVFNDSADNPFLALSVIENSIDPLPTYHTSSIIRPIKDRVVVISVDQASTADTFSITATTYDSPIVKVVAHETIEPENGKVNLKKALKRVAYYESIYPHHKVFFDQYSYEALFTLAEVMNINTKRWTKISVTEKYNSDVAKTVQNLMNNEYVKIPKDFYTLVGQLKIVRKIIRRENLIKVEAPPPLHDDEYSSFSRGVYELVNLENKDKVLKVQKTVKTVKTKTNHNPRNTNTKITSKSSISTSRLRRSRK